MKIAIIHQKYTTSGGMESYLMDLLKGFSEQSDRITLYVYKVNPKILKKKGVDIHCTPLSFLPRRWRRYVFWQKLNTTFNKNDFDLSISLTRTACQDISVCGGTHLGMIHCMSRHFRDRMIHDRIENSFEKCMLKKVPNIIAHSNRIADELIQYYNVPLKKLKVLHPPSDVEKFKPIDQATIRMIGDKYAIDSQKLNLLFPSVGHHCKGLTQLLTAFEQLPNTYQLYLVGARPRKRLPKNVHFLGYIKNLAPLYAAMNYTILPSNYEAYGLVVAESLACLTPVILTAQVGIGELLTKEEAIIIPDNKPETLCQTIQNLPSNITIEPGFAVRQQLTIEQHINAIKTLKRAHQ